MADSDRVLRAAIIGCGQIAGGYDQNYAREHILTHAKAYKCHLATEVIAVADIDGKKAEQFAQYWQIPGFYSDGQRMLEEVCPDIVSICTPDNSHDEWLETCLNFPIKAVWCEKPLVVDEIRGERLVKAYEQQGTLLAVNYLRRWDPHLSLVSQHCREYAKSGLKAVVLYGKGLRNNGSHAIDLLSNWFGGVRRVKALSCINDYQSSDPTVTAFIEFENGAEAYLIGNDERCYTLWEIDVIGPGWRFRLVQSGLELHHYHLRDAPVFGGYRELEPSPTIHKTDLLSDMYWALDNIVAAIHDGKPLCSTGRSSLETLRICNQLICEAHLLS